MPSLAHDRFIKLTTGSYQGRATVYLNRFKIVAIHAPNDDGNTPVATEGGTTYYVVETPEQVVTLAGFPLTSAGS